MKYSIYILISILISTSAQAATWYVSPSGNDNNAGTLSAPFKNIPAAIEAANPGDEILLRGGNYTSNEIRIGKSNLAFIILTQRKKRPHHLKRVTVE